jgi:Cys-tRNA(Pro)/Cys-tRNA(Cys) deacylase
MKGPLEIHQHLLAHDVQHEIVRVPRGAHSTACPASALAEALALPPHRCVGAHPFRAAAASGDALIVLLAAADDHVDPSAMSARLSSLLRARLGGTALFVPASPEFVSERTDYLAGHVSPLLLPDDVVTVATQALADLATTVVYTATGDPGTAIGLRALDLLVLARALVLPQRRVATPRRPVRIDLERARTLELDIETPSSLTTGRPRRGVPGSAAAGAAS